MSYRLNVRIACVLLMACVSGAGGCAAGGGRAPGHSKGGTPVVEVPINKPPATQPFVLTGSSATLIIHGLACPSCARGVQRELKQLPGITGVELDSVEGIVTLDFDERRPPNSAELKQAVQWGGAILLEIHRP
jgi:copper chaperone CopZ